MENNTTPPTQIEVTESFPFIIYKGCIYTFNDQVPEGATILNAPNVDTAMGYLSEQSVNEMLAENDKEIEILKSEVPQWINADIEPHCYESGNWDGKRSDWHLVETKEGLSVGRCYSGFMDGSSFCCWYSDKDYEIEVIRYQKINQY